MAHIIGGSVIKSQGCELSRADLEKQADVLRLAMMGDPRCDLLWRNFERSDPSAARLVTEYVEALSRERQRANRRADNVIVKSSKAYCVSCHDRLKPRFQHCPSCGRQNPHYVTKKGGRVSKYRVKKQKNRKQKYTVKAQREARQHVNSAFTGGAYNGADPGQAVIARMSQLRDSPDPAVRDAALKFFNGAVLIK